MARSLAILWDRYFPLGFIFLTVFHFLSETGSSMVPLSQVITPFFLVYEEFLVFFGFFAALEFSFRGRLFRVITGLGRGGLLALLFFYHFYQSHGPL